MYDTFLKLYEVMQYTFYIEGYTFTLWNVFEASIVCTILGLAISDIIFFSLHKR